MVVTGARPTDALVDPPYEVVIDRDPRPAEPAGAAP